MKLKMMKNYKKYFTLANMETVKEIKSDSDLIASLDEEIKIVAGLGDIIKCEAEICIHKGAELCGEDVDILFNILVKYDINTYEEITIYLTDIWKIAGDQKNYGYRRVFKSIN